MNKYLLLIFLALWFYSCKTKHSTVITKKAKTERKIVTPSRPSRSVSSPSKSTSKASKIVNYSKQYIGTRYKYGGTTRKGMDCSGLVYESFKAHQVYLPRISRDIAKKGRKIELRKTLKGDLLFFKTNKNKRNAINHVGLVVEIKNNAIYFIHATSSKGVIVSSLNDSYWKKAFSEVRRIL
jgi:cell wall-associated NlpC family hydrolase